MGKGRVRGKYLSCPLYFEPCKCYNIKKNRSYLTGQGCTASTDFIFVLDSSGSLVDQPLRTNNWAFIQEFLQVAVLNIADSVERNYTGAAKSLRFGLVQFRDIGVITFGLNDFR